VLQIYVSLTENFINMAIQYRNVENQEILLQIAEQMVVAARTAPKTRGKDVIHVAIVSGDDIHKLAEEMKSISIEFDQTFFSRDANNVLNSSVIVLIGCEIKENNLNPCGMCGFENCNLKSSQKNVPCVFNTIDLGIAIGSAVSVAADARVDNRIMYTIGQAALNLEYFSENVKIVCGIPISAKSKNIYFDRK
jgi:uncharacterized ferredoxin-like protein